MKFIDRLYKPEFLLHKSHVIGELPTAKEAYGTALQMAWPAVTETLLVGLAAFVDTAMVGGLGTEAIAAVGITSQPKFILLALFFALNTGVVAIIARRKGEKDQESARRTFRQSIVITMGLSILMCALGIIFAKELLMFAGANEEYIEPAMDYFRIILAAFPITTLSMVITAAQRGAGNTRVSMRANLIANVVNVVFNYLLIGGNFGFPALGVEGAALATNLGSLVGLVIAVLSVISPDGFLQINFRESWKLDRVTSGLVVKIASSAAVEQVFLRIGFLLYAKMVANLGTTEYATHQIAMQILGLSFNFGDGLSVASTALVGQSLGRKRPDHAIIYGKCCQRMSLVCAAVIIISFTCFGAPLMGLFTPDLDIIQKGAFLLLIGAFISPFQVSQVVLNGSLRGSGDTRFVALTSLVSVAIIRPALTWLLIYPANMGVVGAWYAMAIDQSMRYVISQWRFSSGKWTKIKI